MKKILIVCMLISGLLTGCQSETSTSESLPIETTTAIKETSTEPLPDFVLNTDNILFTADCNYAYNCQNPLKHCIMCIRTDGEVYTATTDLSGNFFRNLYECDNIVWDIAENITHIGTLTDDELLKLIEYTENVNLNSKADVRNDEEIPAVEVFDSYTFYSYKWDSDGKRKSFYIKSHDTTGIPYATLDENALNALELVKNSESYKAWLSECSRTLGISYLNAEVIEVYENSALVKSDSIGEITIPTVLPDGTSFRLKAGDIIEVKYDGYVAESYPAQIHNVYNIYVCESATVVGEETLSDLEIDEMRAVDDEIDKIFTDEFSKMSTGEKAEYALEILNNLAENGTEEYPYSLIQKNSIYYNGNDMISYSYKCGAGGGIKLEPFDPLLNW